MVKINPETSFHERLTGRYNQWLSTQPRNRAPGMYAPREFDGDWGALGSEEYYLHRLSLLLSPRFRDVTLDEVKQTLFTYTEKILADPKRLASLQEAYQVFDKYCQQFGMSIHFDPNRIHILSVMRYRELSEATFSHPCGVTLRSPLADIILPDDIDPKEQFAVYIHEIGHQVRISQGIDMESDNGYLDEGIVHDVACALAGETGRSTPEFEEHYVFERWVAESLANRLNVPTLFPYRRAQIEAMMSELFSNNAYEKLHAAMKGSNDNIRSARLNLGRAVEFVSRERYEFDKASVCQKLEEEWQDIAQNWGFPPPSGEILTARRHEFLRGL